MFRISKKQLIHFDFQIQEAPVREKYDELIFPISNKNELIKKVRKNAYAQLELIDYLSKIETPIERSFLNKMDFK